MGWTALFQSYDTDGSGELDFDEFLTAARTNLKIGEVHRHRTHCTSAARRWWR